MLVNTIRLIYAMHPESERPAQNAEAAETV